MSSIQPFCREPTLTAEDQSAFISYSREDSDFTLRLAGDLRDAGAAVWFDQADILTGEHWDMAVERALVRCPRMLLILSPASVASVNVNDEVSYALEKGKFVLPILHRDCEIPFRIRRLQYTDFRTDYPRALKGLLRALANLPSHTGQPPASAEPGPQPQSLPETPMRLPEASTTAAIPEKPLLQRLAVRAGIGATILAIALFGILWSILSLRRQPEEAARPAPNLSIVTSPAPALETAHQTAPPPVASTSLPVVVPKPDAPSSANSNARRTSLVTATSKPVPAPSAAAPAANKVSDGSPPAKTGEQIAAIAAKAEALWSANRFQEAFPAATEACDAGIASSCLFLGDMYEYGKSVAKDERHAIALYIKSCDGGDMTGCLSLGYTYQRGGPGIQDSSRAVAAFQKGCDGKDGSSCFALGELFREGPGLIHDNQRAAAGYRKGCDLEDSPSCYHLGVMYQTGVGVPANPKTAADLYRKSCDATLVPACFRMGQLYEQGQGVPVDRAQAASYYRRACNFGFSEACDSLKNLTP